MSHTTRPLLEAHRYLWRGTRWRKGQERLIPAELSGYLVAPDGSQRSIAQLRVDLDDLRLRADLTARESFVVAEFFGLLGYPADLTAGRSPLVGMISSGTQSVAGRTAVTEYRDSAVKKMSAVLELRPGPEPVALQPEEDPLASAWLLSNPIWLALSPVEQANVLEAAYFSAVDLVDRADDRAVIMGAQDEWAERHGVTKLVPLGDPVRSRFEHRRRAFASLAISLHSILSNSRALQACAGGDLLAGWSALPMPDGVGGRVAVESEDFIYTSGDVSAEEMASVAIEVIEGRDPDGRLADVLMDEFRSGRYQSHLDDLEAVRMCWALGRGMAAEENWQIIELSRLAHAEFGTSRWTLDLLIWSAHVASTTWYPDLAWRFTRTVERATAQLVKTQPDNIPLVTKTGYLIKLVRSGCELRRAEQLWRCDRHDDAQDRVKHAFAYQQEAQLAWDTCQAEKETHPLSGLEVQFRAMEILVLIGRLREDGFPIEGFSDEAEHVTTMIAKCRHLLEAHARPEESDDYILHERLQAIEDEFEDEDEILDDPDDSPPS